MKKISMAIICIIAIFFGLSMLNEGNADEAAVQAAILDYVEGIYEVKPERIAKSVDVTLRKYGYWRPEDKTEYRNGSEMNYKQLYDLAAHWNEKGRVDAATEKKEIIVLDLLDKTASAKLVAYWGIDYFHLAKEDGKWKIINVLWQSHPPASEVR